MRDEIMHEDTRVSIYGVANSYRPFEGACCHHLHDLTSRLPECQFEDITILRNIGNCHFLLQLQEPRSSQDCAWVRRGRQETGHSVLRVDSSRPTKLQLRRTQECFEVTHRKVKIEHGRRVLRDIVRSLLDDTRHVSEPQIS